MLQSTSARLRSRRHTGTGIASSMARTAEAVLCDKACAASIARVRLMSLSHKTVEKHRTNLMRKLVLRSAAAVAAYAITHGFV